VRRKVAVIAATGGSASALAAKAATATIPIVFTGGSDPVAIGLVASLNRPGGNVTGVTMLANVLAAKRVELVNEVARGASLVALLVNPDNPSAASETSDMESATRAIGKPSVLLRASTGRELDAAFTRLVEQRANALVVAGDTFFLSQREQIVALAARYAIPVSYPTREFVAAGGLMSYGASLLDMYRLAGVYTGRVLNGEKPGELPVVQPTKFELALNLKTAKALSIQIPDKLLALANEVIE
jgi:putative ABC transport system substrate-binding protein